MQNSSPTARVSQRRHAHPFDTFQHAPAGQCRPQMRGVKNFIFYQRLYPGQKCVFIYVEVRLVAIRRRAARATTGRRLSAPPITVAFVCKKYPMLFHRAVVVL